MKNNLDIDRPVDPNTVSWRRKFWLKWGNAVAGWAWFIGIMALVGVCTHYHWLGFGSGFDGSDYPYR